MNLILNLPVEINTVIFNQLPVSALINNRSVSQAWNKVVAQDEACSIISLAATVASQFFNEGITIYGNVRQANSNDLNFLTFNVKNTISDINPYSVFTLLDFDFDEICKAISVSFKALSEYDQSSRTPHPEFLEAADAVMNKYKASIIALHYDVDETTSLKKIQQIEFAALLTKECNVSVQTQERVNAFFEGHTITIKPKPELPEDYQLAKICGKVANQLSIFKDKHF